MSNGKKHVFEPAGPNNLCKLKDKETNENKASKENKEHMKSEGE